MCVFKIKQTVADMPRVLTELATCNNLLMSLSNMEEISEGRGEQTGHACDGRSMVRFNWKALIDQVPAVVTGTHGPG